MDELISIANAVPYAPYDPERAVSDALSGDRIPGVAGVRDWAGEDVRIISATEGFTHYPLSEIASRTVGGARGWLRADALKFARHVANILRWASRVMATPVERIQEKAITTFDTTFTFNRTESGWSIKVASAIEPLYRLLNQCLEYADATLIRGCPKCARLFYAKRKDQIACSTVCARRLRSKQWYEKKGRKQRGYSKR